MLVCSPTSFILQFYSMADLCRLHGCLFSHAVVVVELILLSDLLVFWKFGRIGSLIRFAGILECVAYAGGVLTQFLNYHGLSGVASSYKSEKIDIDMPGKVDGGILLKALENDLATRVCFSIFKSPES